MTVPDLSVIITAGSGSSLTHRTINSAKRACHCAAQAGVHCEIIVVAHGRDEGMRDYLRQWHEGLLVHEVDIADLGEARNFGVSFARSTFVGFLDTGDLFSEPWLQHAYESATFASRMSVWHPMFSHEFENACRIVRHKSSSMPDCNLDGLLEYDLWTDVMLAPRELLASHPFRSWPPGSGFSHEIRRWYCEVLAENVPVCIVDQTSVYIRARPDGGQHGLMWPGPLFDREPAMAVRQGEATAATQSRARLAGRLKTWGVHYLRQVKSHSRVARNVIGLLRRVQRRLPQIMLSPRPPERQLASEALPDWFLGQWKAIHAVEPDVFPDSWILDRTYIHEFPKPRISGPFFELCERLGRTPTHVFLVPWLVRAGADLEVMNYVRAICGQEPAENIVVIATENTDSPWATALPSEVRFIEFGKRYGQLDYEAQIGLLVRLLLQKAPRVIHNVNSRLGYDTFVRHGRSLRHFSRLFASIFCDNLSPEGKWVGYVFHDLADCFEHLTMVFSDNQHVLDQLHNVFAFDPARLVVHYQPMEASAPPRRPRRQAVSETLDVLWAGRLDRQKRPDILAEIARRCRSYPFHFHVYGYACLEPAAEGLQAGANVTLYGPYASFNELPLEKFGAFLHTAQWDGIPNTLLEGIAAGLPVVASNVGGIGELVISGKTGFLIDPFDNVDLYVEALASIHENKADSDRMAASALELLRRRHSWQAFLQNVAAAPGYLSSVSVRGVRADNVVSSAMEACL